MWKMCKRANLKKWLSTALSLLVILCATGTQAQVGGVVAWGNNEYGQSTPPDGNDFIAITAGGYCSFALKADGSIVGWDRNPDGYGEIDPPEGNDFVDIDAGSLHCLALKSDGSIVGWGYDGLGRATPPSGNDFIAIAAGGSQSLAIKSDGSIVGWGDNYYGQATPPPGNDFITIAAGSKHNLAIKSNGSIVGWGWDNYGQATPPPGNDFIAIAAGRYHSLALRSDGSIVGWGRSEYGQADPPDGNDFIAIAAGGGFHGHSLALKSDGSIVGWGDNEYGQAMPPEGNDYVAISAGGSHSLAIVSKALSVDIDIRPASCFNPLNLRSNGILPVAVLGTEDFDVNDIDIASVRLAGVAPFRSNYQDLTGPPSDDPNGCGCTMTCPDGYTDLILKFRIPELAEALTDIYGQIVRGDELELTITGELHDGSMIEGLDYITVVGKAPNRHNRPNLNKMKKTK